MKKRLTFILLVSMLCLVGCTHSGNDTSILAKSDTSILFDSTFAQVSLSQNILISNQPTDKHSFLSIWTEIPIEERTDIIDLMENSFASGVQNFSVYFSQEDRFVLTQETVPTSYTVSINEESARWVVSKDELLAP